MTRAERFLIAKARCPTLLAWRLRPFLSTLAVTAFVDGDDDDSVVREMLDDGTTEVTVRRRVP